MQVKEQSLCALCNLSVDKKFRSKIVHSDLLPILVKLLEDEDIKVVEAAGGVVANLALSNSNHKIMVEAGVIPKLVSFLFWITGTYQAHVLLSLTFYILFKVMKNYSKICSINESKLMLLVKLHHGY